MLSESLMPASKLREPFFKLCVWNRQHQENSLSSPQTGNLRWLDVCSNTDALEKGFAFVVREGSRELASGGVDVSRNGQDSGATPSPSVPGLVRFAQSWRTLKCRLLLFVQSHPGAMGRPMLCRSQVALLAALPLLCRPVQQRPRGRTPSCPKHPSPLARAVAAEVSLQLLNPTEWKLATFGVCFCEENPTVLDPPCALFAMRTNGIRRDGS